MSDNQARQRLGELLSRIAQLPSAGLEPPQFFANYLQLAVTAVGGSGGALWVLQPEQPPQCYCHLGLEGCRIDDPDQQRLVLECVEQVGKDGGVLVAPPAGGELTGQAGGYQLRRGNSSATTLLFRPLRAANQVAMVFQLIGPDSWNDQQLRTVLALLQQVGETAETYLAHRRAEVLESDRKALAGLLRFAEGVHDSLDPERVVYQVANLARDVVGCSRVVCWVDPAVRRHLRAVSGVDKPDHRAVLLRTIESLARYCLTVDKPIESAREQLPEMDEAEELTGLLKEYFNISRLDYVLLQPIKTETESLGVLVIEGLEPERRSVNLTGIVATISRHGAVALANALQLASMPIVKPWARIQAVRRDPKRRRKWLLRLGAVVLILLVCALLPWDLTVEAPCELKPAEFRTVESMLNGTQIVEIVREQGFVEQGEVIARLSDETLKASLFASQAELEQKQAERSKAVDPTSIRILDLQIARLKRQIELIEWQLAQTTVRAPISGTILTPELKLKEGLSVNQGDPICQIAELSQWQLVMYVPHEEIGWVQRGLTEDTSDTDLANDTANGAASDTANGAVSDAGNDVDDVDAADARQALAVRFFLKAYPEIKLTAELDGGDAISPMARVREEGQVFEVRIDVPPEQLAPLEGKLLSGSSGQSKITTVRRPLGFILLRKLIRFFRMTFF